MDRPKSDSSETRYYLESTNEAMQLHTKIKHYLDAENDWKQIKIIIYKMLGVDEMETI